MVLKTILILLSAIAIIGCSGVQPQARDGSRSNATTLSNNNVDFLTLFRITTYSNNKNSNNTGEGK